jgi:nucleotide-binding universal stress UspA family protein
MLILLAIGAASTANPTAYFARRIAGATGGRIVLLHVLGNKGRDATSERELDEALRILEGLEVETKTAAGPPAEGIIQEAKGAEYDLVILGAPEKPTLAEHLLGSMAHMVLAKAPTSVLVVRGERAELARILICTGGKTYAKPAITEGVGLADALEAEVTLLYVTMAPPSMYTGLETMDEQLSEMLQTDTPEARHLRWASELVEGEGVRGELRLRRGAVADEILRETVVEDYDLIVLGAPLPKGPLREYLLGDVTKQVLSRSEISVLVVRRGEAAEG